MYIDIVPNRNSKPTVLLRESWREGKTIKKRTLANLSSLPLDQIDAIKRILKNEALAPQQDLFMIQASYLHGHVSAVQTAMKQLKLPALIASRPSPKRDAVITMIIARLLNPSSKLAITRWWQDTTLIHSIPSLSSMREDDLYEALDWLLQQQGVIEKKLAKRHLSAGELVLYDLSSSYLEGACCPLACYGYSRDKKRGKKQINYGLLTNRQGCPISIEVFAGNTKDSQTLLNQVEKLKTHYRLKHMLLAGDRGMISQAHIKTFRQRGDIYWVTALKSQQIRTLFKKSVITTTLFSAEHLVEVSDEQYPGERLIACYNHALAQKRRADRQSLITKTEEALAKIQHKVRRKHLEGKDHIGVHVGKVINQFKVGKHVQVEIEDQRLEVKRVTSKIQAEEQLDGLYVIRTNVPETEMTKEEVVRSYKQLTQVEQAFRRLKSVSLEIRPIYHYAENRVKAHVFLCLLSYYVEWHMRKAWTSLLFSDEEMIERKQTMDPIKPATPSPSAKKKALSKTIADGSTAYSYHSLLHHLSTIVCNHCHYKQATSQDKGGKGFLVETQPNKKQAEALHLLKQISVPSNTHS